MLFYQLSRTMALVILVVISFTSCLEGPTGPQGEQGPQGEKGEDVGIENVTIVGLWMYKGNTSADYAFRENKTYKKYNGSNDYGTYREDGNILTLIRKDGKIEVFEYLVSINRLSLRRENDSYFDYIRVSY